MKYLIVGIVCLALGVFFTRLFFYDHNLSSIRETDESTVSGSQLSNDTFENLSNKIARHETDIHELRSKIDNIVGLLNEHDSFHRSSESSQSSRSEKLDNITRQEQHNIENLKRFEAELSRYNQLPSGSTAAYELEAQIQDLLLSPENSPSVNYDSLECKPSGCSLSLNQIKFRTEFEALMFKVLELPQLKNNQVFIEPLPVNDRPLNYRVIISTSEQMH